MAGSISGGLRAANTNKLRYGEDFYRVIAKKGGSKRHPETRHWFVNREAARIAGANGGRKSRRGPKVQADA